MFLKPTIFQQSLVKRLNYTFGGNNSFMKKDSFSDNTKSQDGVNMAYSSYETTMSIPNEPTPLVIFHGLFGSKSNWNAFSKVYHNMGKPGKRRVFAVDARNHADSPFTESHSYDDMVMDLKKFVKKMNLPKVSLLGHCMGGRACMLFSLKYPELVDKLIVSDISPITTSINFKSICLLFSIMKVIKLPKNIPLSQAKSEVNRQLIPVVPNKALRTFMMNNLVQTTDGSYKWSLNLPTLMNNYENVAGFPEMHNAAFEGPVLFLGGGNSDFIQKSDLSKIQKLFPKAELKYMEGTGHWLQTEKPIEFLKITVDFLNKVDKDINKSAEKVTTKEQPKLNKNETKEETQETLIKIK
ncbi:unnamed protein product [Brassicogethes aeneus]|uniref:sn-1-specific diacylglycerol lipase ABHD11 n=1 Tax=Brassicogethes aeneus TaxID=1431903 RepID=A0A9P0FE50_BRAAE|nr:unnamed protein product [Brassicogethes aeneus]